MQTIRMRNALATHVSSLIANHIDDHKLHYFDSEYCVDRAVEWPQDAMYAVVYTTRAWPTAAQRNYQFFGNAHQLKAWHQSMTDWSRFEDNAFELETLYLWDLGPNVVDDLAPHLN